MENKQESYTKSQVDTLFNMQLYINKGIFNTQDSLIMRIKRLEEIVESLSDVVYNERDLENPTSLGIITGTDFFKR